MVDMVEPISDAIRQALDERVLRGQHGEHPFGIGVARDELRNLCRELVRKPHHNQKRPLLFRQRVYHGGGKCCINIGISVRQRAPLGERAQVQIHGGEPALAGIQQALDLRVGQVGPAAVAYTASSVWLSRS